MTHVIIVDDDPQFRQELRALLERWKECVVVDEAITPTEVIAMAQRHHPAVVLLNGDLAGSDGLEIAWLLRFYDAAVGIIVLAQVPDEERLFQFLKVGAHAYIARPIAPEGLLETVRRVSAGEFLFSLYSS
jgi:DNA-binding NarL/FixJ family response regulator